MWNGGIVIKGNLTLKLYIHTYIYIYIYIYIYVYIYQLLHHTRRFNTNKLDIIIPLFASNFRLIMIINPKCH